MIIRMIESAREVKRSSNHLTRYRIISSILYYYEPKTVMVRYKVIPLPYEIIGRENYQCKTEKKIQIQINSFKT